MGSGFHRANFTLSQGYGEWVSRPCDAGKVFQYLCLGFLSFHFLGTLSSGWDKRSWAKAHRSRALGCGYESTEGPTDISSLPKQGLKRRSAQTTTEYQDTAIVLQNSAGRPAQPCTSAQPSCALPGGPVRSCTWVTNTLPRHLLHFCAQALGYRYKSVRLRSTAPVRAAILIIFWFYKQDDSENRVTEFAEHALGSWCPEPPDKHDTQPPPGPWPDKLNFFHLLFHSSKLSNKS